MSNDQKRNGNGAPPAPKDVLAVAKGCGLLMDDGTSCYREDTDISDVVVTFAHAALARWGRPAAPPAQEVGAALADLENLELAFESSFECKVRTSRIRPALLHYATLLQQLSAPAPAVVPVAVSERPWEREGWCDEQGRCWFFSPRFNTWSWERPPFALTRGVGRLLSCPFHAIPLPQAGEGEV